MEFYLGKGSREVVLQKFPKIKFQEKTPSEFFQECFFLQHEKVLCGPLEKKHLVVLREQHFEGVFFWSDSFFEEILFCEKVFWVLSKDKSQQDFSSIKNFWQLKTFIKEHTEEFKQAWIQSGLFWVSLRVLLKREVVTWKDLYLLWTVEFMKSKENKIS